MTTQPDSTTPAPTSAPARKPGLFTAPDGTSLLFTFLLVCTLFFLWGVFNSMIDTMDKHFQDKLHLTRANSAWVQFAHYLGYFLMSIPAGWLARKLGYKGGIISGLLIVVLGGFWMVPATHINTFPAFLFGVCLIAMGLTFLETIANPYTTVLGPRQYAATRINIAQTANGMSWFFGPVLGAMFFYNVKSGAPASAATIDNSFSFSSMFSTIGAWFKGTVAPHQETLFIPYFLIACFVLVLVVVFIFAKIPNLKAADDYSGKVPEMSEKFRFTRGGRNGLLIGLGIGIAGALLIMWTSGDFGKAVDQGARGLGVISGAIGNMFAAGDFIGVLSTLLGAAFLCFIIGQYRSLPHVAGGVISQFLYVACQAGIFSFFLNYMVADTPAVGATLRAILHPFFVVMGWITLNHVEPYVQYNGLWFFSDGGGTLLFSIGFLCFFAGRVVGSVLTRFFPAHKVFGAFAAINVALSAMVFLKLGWLSVLALFLSMFFMSIMFPTIFALGIHGLGEKAKTASSFIVMAILGGAVMPKLMGALSDKYGHVQGHLGREIVTGPHANTNLMSPGFIVPFFCFIVLAAYGFLWPKLARVTDKP